METLLTGEILKALTDGDVPKALGYGLIFAFLWIEVRGLKNAVKQLNTTIGQKFMEGEQRFERNESLLTNFEIRLAKMETSQGGKNG